MDEDLNTENEWCIENIEFEANFIYKKKKKAFFRNRSKACNYILDTLNPVYQPGDIQSSPGG